MGIQIERRFMVAAPPKQVCAAMRDAKLIEDDEKGRQALQTEVTDKVRDDHAHHYEIRSVNYYRGVTGIDKTKTEQSIVNVKWDLDKLACSWIWSGTNEHAKRVSVSGTYAVVPKGDGAEMVLRADIDVSIPLIGKKIAEKISSEMTKEWPKYHQLVTQWVKKG